MRRIIDGETYDTETAAMVAAADAVDRTELYISREGRYFLHYGPGHFLASSLSPEEREEETAEPSLWEEGRILPLTDDPEHIGAIFVFGDGSNFEWTVYDEAAWRDIFSMVGETPESVREGQERWEATEERGDAEALEEETEATISVPRPLKLRLDAKAQEAGMSVNAYVIQCLEPCLREIQTIPVLTGKRDIQV